MEYIVDTKRVYSILEINTIVRGLLREAFPETIWVRGEIQDLRISDQKKHAFFCLVQKHPEADEIVSKIDVVMFEQDKKNILKKLSEMKEGFSLREDIEVKLLCRVDSYPKWGRYQLIAVDIDAGYTLGQLARTRERILQNLKERGLLEKNKQLPLPVVPLRIGLITSRDSAAYHDFISELKQSGFSFIVHCFDAHMQGVNVEKDLIRALDYFNSLKKSLDLIVISRGGGSTADLSWFDNQRIAEKTAAADIPVISAIGHEINCTITDLVAHTYFKTPTKAAQFLVEKVTEFLEALLDRQGRIVEGTLQSLDRGKQQLQTSLLKMQVNLQQASRKAREGLLGLKFRITNQAVSFLSEQQGLLSALQDRVGILDPQHVLKRGFSITYHGGKVLKDAALAAEGAVIQTVLLKGTISSKIVKEKE